MLFLVLKYFHCFSGFWEHKYKSSPYLESLYEMHYLPHPQSLIRWFWDGPKRRCCAAGLGSLTKNHCPSGEEQKAACVQQSSPLPCVFLGKGLAFFPKLSFSSVKWVYLLPTVLCEVVHTFLFTHHKSRIFAGP